MLFNIIFNDLFMFVSDRMICNYADGTSIYACDYKNEEIRKLENDVAILSNWFWDTSMKINRQNATICFPAI